MLLFTHPSPSWRTLSLLNKVTDLLGDSQLLWSSVNLESVPDQHWPDKTTDIVTTSSRLLHAVRRGSLQEVRNLLQQDSLKDLRRSSPNVSFLLFAGMAGRRQVCQVLLRHGADPNEVRGVRAHSLLHTAVASGNYGFASLLLAAGAAPSPQNSSLSTPLHFAARSNQEYMAAKLLKYGADALIRDGSNRTAVDLAIEKDNFALAKFIEDRC
ncbi:ankyrin repeat domain-containing protein [bacterium]|nr:ankyrin repeat domain-containing protein [bacterium]